MIYNYYIIERSSVRGAMFLIYRSPTGSGPFGTTVEAYRGRGVWTNKDKALGYRRHTLARTTCRRLAREAAKRWVEVHK